MHLKLSVSDLIFEMSDLILQLENKLLAFFAMLASLHLSALVGLNILKCSCGTFGAFLVDLVFLSWKKMNTYQSVEVKQIAFSQQH